MIQNQYKQSGFTIIEMIVSLGVFSIVITIAVGALLLLVASNRQLQDEQVVMANLSFALDSMTREIRTGRSYYCDSRTDYSAGGTSNNIFRNGNNLDSILDQGDFQDCEDGRSGELALHGLAFIEGGGSITGGSDGRILYFIDYTQNNETSRQIYRRVGSGDSEPITSSDIHIERLDFFVTDSEPQSSGDNRQPTVTIVLQASKFSERTDPNRKIYNLQTTLTQRVLDL